MKHSLLFFIVVIPFLVSSCTKDDPATSTEEGTNQQITVPDDNTVDSNGSGSEWASDAALDVVDKTDEDYVENSTFSTQVIITYNGASATVVGLPASGVTADVSGADVIINSTLKEIAYLIKGKTSDGSLKIYSDKKFKMELDSAVITNPSGAAINIQSSKRVFCLLTEGKTSTLTDGSQYDAVPSGEDCKAAFFSEGQVIFSGKGRLIVNANYKHGICSDDYVRMRPGTTIQVKSAPKDGVHSNGGMIVGGGLLNITSSGDGIEVEEGGIDIAGGEIVVKSVDDGLSASYDATDTSILPYLKVSGGTITVTTSGEKGQGLKSTGTIEIAGGTLNIVTKGNGAKTLSSDGNMILNGGTLTLKSYGEAFYDSDDSDISSPSCVKCDGDLVISGAVIEARATGSAGKGLSVDGNLTISSGSVTVITTGKQFIYNKLDSSPKGIKAEGNLAINGGSVSVTASGGEGSEGIESKSILTINGGTIEVECYDDCINSAKQLVINGGNIYCFSSNNDAIDSNGSMKITGGLVLAFGTTAPEGGFDCDNNIFSITGGTLIGMGGENSTPTSGSCTQRVVLYGGSAVAGQYLSVSGGSGSIMICKVPRSYSQMSLLFSSPSFNSSLTYNIYSGGSVSGGQEFHGYYTGSTYSGGTSLISFAPTNMVTTVGNTTGGGNPGGGGQGVPK